MSTITVDWHEYSRLMDTIQGIKDALGGVHLDQAFYDQDFGPYDKGRYDGMLFIVTKVSEALEKETDNDVPF